MRAALASPGLGHIRRGNEMWALRTAEALHAAGADVTLFGGGPVETNIPYVRLPVFRRTSWLMRRLFNECHSYIAEQWRFTKALLPRLDRDGFDVLHTGDPQVAWWAQKHFGVSGTAVFYKDGLLLGPAWNKHFRRVQVLSPWAMEEAVKAGADTTDWRMIPHAVDLARFSPPSSRAAARRGLGLAGLPEGAPLVLSVGALGAQSNKRLDYMAGELAGLKDVHWLVAGQAGALEREVFEREVRSALGHRLHLLTNVAPERMPLVFQAADVFAHAALHEPFGIVFLEALATGLPVYAHHFEVTRWIVGEAGACGDLTRLGELAGLLKQWLQTPARQPALAEAARRRASAFSLTEIVPQYLAWHEAARRNLPP